MNTAKLTPLSDYACSTDWKEFMPVHGDSTRRLYNSADELCTDTRTLLLSNEYIICSWRSWST